MSIKDEMRQLGYSKEDEYFFKKDQELLAKMRAAANTRKQEIEDKHKAGAYWMTCPKCGTALEEEVLEEVVRIDSCSSCGGTFFDQGELELLIQSRLGSSGPGA